MFEPTELIKGLSQLDYHLFKATQRSLEADLDTFVSVFDDEPPSATVTTPRYIQPADLTTAFIQLNTCHVHLDVARKQKQEWQTLSKDLEEMKLVNQQVRSVMSTLEQRNTESISPLAEQRERFLDEINRRKKQYDTEIQRQYDKLEEVYAKKMRDSIYRNLVGSNHWLHKQ